MNLTSNDIPSSTNCHLQDYNIVRSQEHLDAVYETQVFSCLLNSIFAVVATLANGAVLVAILKTSSLHRPSNVFLVCLSLTDLLTGLIVQPTVVVVSALLAHSRDHRENMETLYFSHICSAFTFYLFATAVLSAMTMLNLTAISVDKCLALRLHLRYNEFVTVRRVAILQVCFLCACVTVAIAMMLEQMVVSAIIAGIGVVACLPISFAAQMSVFSIVREHERRVVDEIQLSVRLQNRQIPAAEIAKVKKNSRTVLLMWAVLFVCLTPAIGALIAFAVYGFTPAVNNAFNITVTIVFINSSINPLLYGARIGEIREAVLLMLRRK